VVAFAYDHTAPFGKPAVIRYIYGGIPPELDFGLETGKVQTDRRMQHVIELQQAFLRRGTGTTSRRKVWLSESYLLALPARFVKIAVLCLRFEGPKRDWVLATRRIHGKRLACLPLSGPPSDELFTRGRFWNMGNDKAICLPDRI
jgi:hypothetical protein